MSKKDNFTPSGIITPREEWGEFEAQTIVTKDELSNLKRIILDDNDTITG
jgi:hypothetical protein